MHVILDRQPGNDGTFACACIDAVISVMAVTHLGLDVTNLGHDVTIWATM